MKFVQKYSLKPLSLIIATTTLLAVSGCVATPVDSEQVNTVAEPAAEVTVAAFIEKPKANPAAESGLSAELLYDVLVASVASQRQQPKVALEALSRAVYLSRNKRLNVNAIQLALHIDDYQKAIELSRLLLITEPDNFRIKLALANAQIKSEKLTEAAQTLIELASQQEIGSEAILQEVASIIARQDAEDTQILQSQLQEAATDERPVLVFTSALLSSRLQQQQQFRKELDRSLTLQPEWETAAILKLTDLAEEQVEAMSPYAKGYLENFPQSERFRVQFARLLIRQNQYQEALQELEIVIEQNPASEDALFAAAVVNLDTDSPGLAEKYFLDYIAVSDFSDQARLYLAQLYIEQKRYAEASPLLRQIQASQYYLDAQVALSGVIAKQSNVDAGLSYLRNIDVRSEADRVRLILEQDLLLRDFDQKQRSLALLTQALEERPKQPDLLYSRGLLAAQLNQVELIEKDMRQLIELQPDNAHAYNALGYTLADQTDRYEEAVQLIAKALEFLPDDAFILDSMGWVQFRIGNHDKALEYLERAMSIRQDAEIAAHLGEVLWVSGDRIRAEKIWQQGLELGPDNPTLINTINRLKGQSHADDQSASLAPPVGLTLASVQR